MSDDLLREQANVEFYEIRDEYDRAQIDDAARVLQAMERPVFFVGLGGTGTEVVARVKQRWGSAPSDLREQRVGFFCVDTVPLTEDESTDPVVRRELSRADEYVALCPEKIDFKEWLNHQRTSLGDERYNQLYSWLDQRRPPSGSQLGPHGAGAYRQLGRLALAYGIDGVHQAMLRARSKLTRPREGAADRRLGEPDVVIVCGMSGGTGSGIFMDMVRMVHVVFDGNARVSAVLVLPRLFREVCTRAGLHDSASRMMPNAYALLKELDYVLAEGRTREEVEEQGLNLPWFRNKYCPADLKEYLFPPFLIDNNLGGSVQTVDDRRSMVDVVASSVFALMVSRDALRKIESNHDGRFLTCTPNGHRRAYAGLGSSRVLVPTFSVVKYLGRRLYIDAVESFLCSQTEQTLDADDEAQNRLYDSLKAPLSVIARSADSVTIIEPTERDHLGEKPFQSARSFRENNMSEQDVRGWKKSVRDEAERRATQAIAESGGIIDEFVRNQLRRGTPYVLAALDNVRRRLAKGLESLPGTPDPGIVADIQKIEETLHRGETFLGVIPKLLNLDASKTDALNLMTKYREQVRDELRVETGAAQKAYLSRICESESGGNNAPESLLSGAATGVSRIQRHLSTAAQKMKSEVASMRIGGQEGTVGHTTLLLPEELRDEGERAVFLERVYRERIAGDEKAMAARVDRAFALLDDQDDFRLLNLALKDNTRDRRLAVGAVIGAFATIAREQLEAAGDPLTQGIVGVLGARDRGIEQVERSLLGLSEPMWRMHQVGDGTDPVRLSVTSAPSDVDAGRFSAPEQVIVGPTSNEITRVEESWGAALEYLTEISSVRSEYLEFVGDDPGNPHRGEPIHIAVGLEELPDPISDGRDISQSVYEALTAGLIAGSILHWLKPDMATQRIATLGPEFRGDKLPSPIERHPEQGYLLAPYHYDRMSDQVILRNEPSERMGTTIEDAVRFLAGKGKVRIEALTRVNLRLTTAEASADYFESLVQSIEDTVRNDLEPGCRKSIGVEHDIWARILGGIEDMIRDLRRRGERLTTEQALAKRLTSSPES